MIQKHNTLFATLGLALTLLFGCGGDGEDDYGPLACEYEESTTSCSGSGFGPYEPRCLDIEFPQDDLTPTGWCNAVISDTTECAGSCCLSFRFRNAVGRRGLCDE